MRRLLLLRHAKSSWDDPSLDDFERPLAERGRKAARLMGRHMAESVPPPSLILCSTARRTRETLAIMEKRLAGIPVRFEGRLYEAATRDLLKLLREMDDGLDSAMLIGHNPGLEHLALALCGGRGDAEAVARLEHKYPTGALAIMDVEAESWSHLREGGCALRDFIRPRDLKDSD